MRQRMNVYLSPELVQQVADLSARRKLSQSAIVEAAVMSFLSPDGDERREAAFARRLDRLTRQVQRLERNTLVTMEMLALFARFFFTVTPQLPPQALAAAQAKGRERFDGLVKALGQRLQAGASVLSEIPEDVDENEPSKGTSNGAGDGAHAPWPGDQ